MAKYTPTEINLHRQSKVLEISFSDDSNFNLPCEFLRVYSPSADVAGHTPEERKLEVGKDEVNIDRIEPVGNYAVCLHFDDGHTTGIYSWETLYKMGQNHATMWQQYLDDLKAAGLEHKPTAS